MYGRGTPKGYLRTGGSASHGGQQHWAGTPYSRLGNTTHTTAATVVNEYQLQFMRCVFFAVSSEAYIMGGVRNAAGGGTVTVNESNVVSRSSWFGREYSWNEDKNSGTISLLRLTLQ